jgi:hypothetical protein
MKKILTHLTGIVFVITILIAFGCSNINKKKDPPKEENNPAILADSTKVDIFLKAILMDGSMHLEMSDSRNPDCGVVDDHLIVVKRGYTVKWKNASGSIIDEILHIRPVGDSTFFGAVPELDTSDVDSAEFFSISKGILKLVIPDTASLDTLIKYEIVFTVKEDTTTYTIDPYLKIPKQQTE